MMSVDESLVGNEGRLVEIVKRIGGSKTQIQLSTLVYHDLRIDGDDAAELLADISNSFAVSFKGMDFHAYFPDETEAIWWHWGSKLGIVSLRRFRPCTIGHLLNVIDRGEWFDPIE
jgi:hypothetical protein